MVEVFVGNSSRIEDATDEAKLFTTGKLIIGKLSEFIGILTANCCTAILRPFQRCFGANSSFAAVSEVFWELIAPNLMILLLFRSNIKYKIILKD